jgi:hypothetical protein
MKKHVLVAGAALLVLSGCASIFNGKTQKITLKSAPDGATAVVTNGAGQSIHTGTTPVTLELNRGAGYFKSESYTVVLSKAGFVPKEVKLTATVSGWYIGNILFGGLIGMLAVDPVTGAMYTFPEAVSETLQPQAAKKTSALDGGLTIVSTETLGAEQMKLARPLHAAPRSQ